MKIVHMTTVHDPFDIRIFYKQCRSLARMGHSVTLIAAHDRDELVEGVTIKALPAVKGRLRRIFCQVRRAYRLALQEKADIYHFHDPELSVAALALKRKGMKRIVYDVHEDYYSLIKIKGYLPRPLRTIIAAVFCRLERMLTRGFAKVLAEKYYRDSYPDGVTVLNYPAADLLKLPLQKPHSEKLQLIYTGNITADRGALAHARTLTYLDQARVYLIGKCDPDFAEELYRVAGSGSDRLTIVGKGRFVPFSEITAFYARGGWTAGLALFPPNDHYVKKELTKFFEYMGAGIPVVCSDFPAWKNLFEQTGAGICVDPLDENKIKEALTFLFSNQDQAQQMGRKGRASVQDQFKWENEALKLERFYGELLEKETDGT